MKRRDLIAGLALASVEAGAQTGAEEAAGSLYIPKAHVVEDRRFLHDFMDEFAFVELVTVAPSLRITHIPVWLDRAAGAYGTIHGHVARQNPQHAAFDGKQTGVVVFRGPDGYISPAWYTGGGMGDCAFAAAASAPPARVYWNASRRVMGISKPF